MLFFRGFLLSLTAATAVLSGITYVRWMLTLSETDQWLRNSFPLQFHLHHLTALIGYPLIVWVLTGLFYFVPVFLAFAIAERYRVATVFYYLGGAVLCAAVNALTFVSDPHFDAFKMPVGEQYALAVIGLLPSCLVGAWVFWLMAGRTVAQQTDQPAS
jgi:hypothetical protein